MLMYISMVFMIITCLVGVYTIAGKITDWIYEKKTENFKKITVLPANNKSTGLEIQVRSLIEKGGDIVIADCGMSGDILKIAEKLTIVYLSVRLVKVADLGKYVENVTFATE